MWRTTVCTIVWLNGSQLHKLGIKQVSAYKAVRSAKVPAKPDEDVCRHVQQVTHVAEGAIAAVQRVS